MFRALPKTKHREEQLREVNFGTQSGSKSISLLELLVLSLGFCLKTEKKRSLCLDFYTTLTGFGICVKEQTRIKSACPSEELEREVVALFLATCACSVKNVAEYLHCTVDP